MATLTTKFIRQPYRPVNPKSVEQTDKTILNDCADAYNDLLWTLARKVTDSSEEARAVVREMFADIRQCQKRGQLVTASDEDRHITQIAWRRLKRFLR